jgi:hypothetical protein
MPGSERKKSDPARYLPLILIGAGVIGLGVFYYYSTKGTGTRRNLLEEIRDPNSSIKPV